jgi:ABC-type Zn uptake system ZnuABC Zn-binding protein ZnuA
MSQRVTFFWLSSTIALTLMVLTACGSARASVAQNGKLNVVATTTLVGDTVRRVAGDSVNLTVLLPPGTDGHSYEPTPQDIAAVADANVVFANGLGYETFLQALITNADSSTKVVEVSRNITPLTFTEEGQHAGEQGDEGLGVDPHVWFNPLNVASWTGVIADQLGALDTPNATTYKTNAEKYQAELQQLDNSLKAQFTQIPPERRKLVTDHDTFGYLASHYHFDLVGAVIPSTSSTAEPSAQEIAALEETVKKYNVPAVFVANEVNASVAKRLTADTGIKLVSVYVESLSQPGGPADTYVAFMQYNAAAITNGLK